MPVVFEAPIASSLISHFIGAISGGALYRKASFLLDQKGHQIFPDFMRIHEQPLLPAAMGSAAYDNEGVATRTRDIVRDGVLQDYVLSRTQASALASRIIPIVSLHPGLGLPNDRTTNSITGFF